MILLTLIEFPISLILCFNLLIVKAAILKCCGPNTCEVVFNLVPKKYAMSDIYCQLIPNDNESDPYY